MQKYLAKLLHNFRTLQIAKFLIFTETKIFSSSFFYVKLFLSRWLSMGTGVKLGLSHEDKKLVSDI